jgi:hypothetical protein
MPGIFVRAPLTRPPVQLSAKTTFWLAAARRLATRLTAEERDMGEELGRRKGLLLGRGGEHSVPNK